MSLYKELYYKLFAAMADAVEELEAGIAEEAYLRLIKAQREAEERYISADPEEDEE